MRSRRLFTSRSSVIVPLFNLETFSGFDMNNSATFLPVKSVSQSPMEREVESCNSPPPEQRSRVHSIRHRCMCPWPWKGHSTDWPIIGQKPDVRNGHRGKHAPFCRFAVRWESCVTKPLTLWSFSSFLIRWSSWIGRYSTSLFYSQYRGRCYQGFPDPGSPATELPLIDNMRAQGVLKKNLFGIYMSSDIDQPGKFFEIRIGVFYQEQFHLVLLTLVTSMLAITRLGSL